MGGERGAFGALTDREREVLSLMAEGLTNNAIASRLVLTDRIVEGHVRNVLIPQVGIQSDIALRRRPPRTKQIGRAAMPLLRGCGHGAFVPARAKQKPRRSSRPPCGPKRRSSPRSRGNARGRRRSKRKADDES